MSRNTIIYLAGGGLSGVFAGGVTKTLQEKNAYPRIKAVYGASAGAMDGAYFLARDVETGTSIYFNEARAGFIEFRNIWPMFRFLRQKGPFYPFHPDHLISVMHVEYLMDVVKNKKPLNVDRLVRQPIPFYVKLLNQHTHKIEYVDARHYDPLKVLQATISMPPVTFSYEVLHHNRMVDSCIAEVIGIKRLLARHPGAKIIIILNRRPSSSRLGKYMLRAEAYAGARMYGKAYASFPAAREAKFVEEVALAKNFKNVLMIMPPRASPTKPQTTDLAKLKETYALGRRAGLRAWEFMNA